METESEMVVARGQGEEYIGNRMMKKFWRLVMQQCEYV